MLTKKKNDQQSEFEKARNASKKISNREELFYKKMALKEKK